MFICSDHTKENISDKSKKKNTVSFAKNVLRCVSLPRITWTSDQILDVRSDTGRQISYWTSDQILDIRSYTGHEKMMEFRKLFVLAGLAW